MMVAALALASGCGDNDNSDNGNSNDNGGGNPTPVRTSTAAAPTATPGGGDPTATPTPSASTQTVTFDLTVTSPVEGYRIEVSYPENKGSFTGSGATVGCTFDGNGSFVPNDQDNGTLVFVNGNALALTFPQTITCTFDATSPLVAGDVTATVTETTQNGGQAGDTAALAVAVNIS
jgi:hypothetical protein